MIKTREQEYAAKIYDQVEEVKSKSKQFKDEYKTSAKNLAFLIRSAGLVQALYFTQTRNKASELLIKHLVVVIEKPTEPLTENQLETLTKGFLEKVRTTQINEYMFLTEKCLLALKWYKRFVDIHIKDKDEKSSTKNEVEKDDNISE
jgi:CRISPR type III-B/RAMP module-associated protein Cmr5